MKKKTILPFGYLRRSKWSVGFLFGLSIFLVQVLSCSNSVAILQFDMPGTVTAGTNVSADLVLRNTRQYTTSTNNDDESTWRYSFYLSLDKYPDASDVALFSDKGPVLEGGESFSTIIDLDIPTGTASGNYYVLARSPGYSEFAKVTVNGTSNAGIDLTAINVFLNDNNAAGQTIPLYWTAYNFGLTPSASCTAKLYLSDDDTLDGSDPELDPVAIPALGPLGKTDISHEIFINGNTATGYHYLFIETDAAEQQF